MKYSVNLFNLIYSEIKKHIITCIQKITSDLLYKNNYGIYYCEDAQCVMIKCFEYTHKSNDPWPSIDFTIG